MPDFSAQWTAGVEWREWHDPPVPPDPDTLPPHERLRPKGKPSRLNPRGGRNHRHAVAKVGQWVEAKAKVDGTEGPPDSALGGRTFSSWLVEVPMHYPLGVVEEPGHSSVVRFKPPAAGHYTFILRRKDGGSIIMHLDAEG